MLGDVRGFGVAAVLIAPSETVGRTWSDVRGLVVAHGPRVRWSDQDLRTIQTLKRDGLPVVLARLTSSRIPPALHGLPTLPLWDRRYKVDPDARVPGHRLLIDIFGQSRAPGRTQRRGFVFVSYRSCDIEWTAGTLVPTLVEHGFGFFDYRSTEELNEGRLAIEIARWVHESEVLLVVASPQWPTSPDTISELHAARAIGRPIVVLRRRAWPPWPRAYGRATATVRFDDPVRDGPALATTLLRAAGLPDPTAPS